MKLPLNLPMAARRYSQNALNNKLVYQFGNRTFERDDYSNVSEHMMKRLLGEGGGYSLLKKEGHPIKLLWDNIKGYFSKVYGAQDNSQFTFHQIDDPIVSVVENFDNLLIDPSHPSRSPQDTYFLNRHCVLRTHMTAHEPTFMQQGKEAFLLGGEVYRRDEIDPSHMPVFHQIEGVKVFPLSKTLNQYPSLKYKSALESLISDQMPLDYGKGDVEWVTGELVECLSGLLKHLFGSSIKIRWQKCHFPFTLPSIEAEIYYQGKWLEVLGSGVLRRQIVEKFSGPDRIAWAFGLGIERLAMILHEIPDIRLFWTNDLRFHSQFASYNPCTDPPIRFKPFSKYPPIIRDISFYLPSEGGDQFNSADFYELVRSEADHLAESVKLIDEFVNAKGKRSLCYRIVLRSMEQTLTDEVANSIINNIRQRLSSEMHVELR